MKRMMMGCFGGVAPDPYTYLLLHYEGSNGSTSFIDSSPYLRTVTANGGISISTARSKFDSASALSDGNADYLTVSGINPGTGKFCFETYFYISDANHANCVFSYGGSDEAYGNGFAVYTGHPNPAINYLMVYASGVRTGTSPVAAGAWHHLALVGNGGADGSRFIRLFLDGTQAGDTYYGNYNFTGKTLWVGANEDAATECFLGNFDETRISIGADRYTGNFTPQNFIFLS